MTMGTEHSAQKLRGAAERPQADETERRKSDAESAEAHADLTHPKHSKARPATGGNRASNAGNDGP
jgi:hypothetical protein